jgi:hypothetical protein
MKWIGGAVTPVVAAIAVAAAVGAGSSSAEDSYPNRLIKIIVPFGAGTTADLIPRLVADKLSQRWDQPIIIEARPGATGNIGAEMARRRLASGTRIHSHLMARRMIPATPISPAPAHQHSRYLSSANRCIFGTALPHPQSILNSGCNAKWTCVSVSDGTAAGQRHRGRPRSPLGTHAASVPARPWLQTARPSSTASMTLGSL